MDHATQSNTLLTKIIRTKIDGDHIATKIKRVKKGKYVGNGKKKNE